MRVRDVSCRARGMVSPSFVDVRTGARVPFAPRHNKLSFMSAEAMAAALGGDPSYIPSRIGFIYGTKGSDPVTFSDISHVQDWDKLKEELSSVSQNATVDVQVVGFSYSPSLGGDAGGSSSSEESDYDHILSTGANAITFHAVSNSQDRGALFDADTFKEESIIYQCLLLGYHQGDYYILARASLEDFSEGTGSYLQKPKGFEVALDWTVAFHV